jgi:iron complex transport system ATP-binding protein
LRENCSRQRSLRADVATIPANRVARTVAAVLQDAPSDFDLRVRDVVSMGRARYMRMFQGDNASDIDAITRPRSDGLR